jgi:hypothetical protein
VGVTKNIIDRAFYNVKSQGDLERIHVKFLDEVIHWGKERRAQEGRPGRTRGRRETSHNDSAGWAGRAR